MVFNRFLTVALLTFSLIFTFVAMIQATPSQGGGLVSWISSALPSSVTWLARATTLVSLELAILGWSMVGVSVIWRRHAKSIWEKRGFSEDVFELFVKMKGASTRLAMLSKLSAPKDRAQLAAELDLDWKTVDRHMQILRKYGLIQEEASYGNIKVYGLTELGVLLLNLVQDLEK